MVSTARTDRARQAAIYMIICELARRSGGTDPVCGRARTSRVSVGSPQSHHPADEKNHALTVINTSRYNRAACRLVCKNIAIVCAAALAHMASTPEVRLNGLNGESFHKKVVLSTRLLLSRSLPTTNTPWAERVEHTPLPRLRSLPEAQAEPSREPHLLRHDGRARRAPPRRRPGRAAAWRAGRPHP